MSEQVELAIVGAGPAGLHAAVAARQTGLSVAVIDAYPGPGGQYFAQPPAPFQSGDRTPHQVAADSLFDRFAASGARLLSDTLVWGAFAADGGGWELALYSGGVASSLVAQALILAPGAYDRPIPFPGWTLPGVLTAGGAQSLVKRQRVLPGRRVLLSGTGPLQLAVAATLVRAGAEVVGVLEGASIGLDTLRHAPAMWGQWERLREGWEYLSTLWAAHVPYRTGWSVVEARGDGAVQEAVIARLDAEWRPVPGTERTLPVDTVVIGYGLLPSTQLARLLGCATAYRREAGAYVLQRDGRMQTSLPGVYAVGDGAGIGGAELAGIEGEIAAVAAAERLGRLGAGDAATRIARLQPRLAKEQRFAVLLERLFTPGAGLYTLPAEDTPICRCEGVTAGQIRAAVADGVRSLNELKGVTRIGMGNCQGRICGEMAARLIAQAAGEDAPAGQFTVRPPIHPLPLSVLAGAERE